MITKWGKKLLAENTNVKMLFYASLSSSNNYGAINAKNAAGTEFVAGPNLATNNSFYYISSITATGSSSSTGVAFGSSDTAPTENDYTITPIAGLEVSSPGSVFTTTYDSVNNKFYTYYNYTVTNNNAEAVTIKEIGKFNVFYKSTAVGTLCGSSSSDKMSVLIDRVVLDDPVTIPAGESAVVRYSVSYS